jgi:hypothetical protein
MQVKLVDLAARIYDEAKLLHERYDREIWQGRPSFHNSSHMDSMWQAAIKIIDQATDNDFLGLCEQCRVWNERFGMEIDRETFADLVHIVVATHDLGNNMDERGHFLEFYTAAGAEERSSMLVNFFWGEEIPAEWMVVLDYMIAQTHFNNGQTTPWARFITIIDQLSTGYFRDNRQALVGLMEERQAEAPGATVIPDREVNFTYYRQRELLKPEELKQLFYVWGVCSVEYEEGWGAEAINIKEFLNQL